jgi:hypothetical protein
VRVAPPADHYLLVHEGHEDRRPDRQPAPLHDALVQLRHDLAHLELGAQRVHPAGQPGGLLAQPQRRRKEFVGTDALAPQPVRQPGLVRVGPPVRQRLAGPGQVLECAPLGRLADLLVDPRTEAQFLRLALRHVGVSSGMRSILCGPAARRCDPPG